MKLPTGFLIVCASFALLAGCGRGDAIMPAGTTQGASITTSETESKVQGDKMTANSDAVALPAAVDKSQFKRAAEISGETWINSPQLDWSSLRGHVVVVDFWTFACYNCKNTLPYVKAWYDKYQAQGLVVLGVHTPELSFEKDVANVRTAVAEYGIKYPVVIDGDFANWNRYNVWAWPTWFIIDKEGYIRYTHVGEGDYAGSERVIQQLLAE